MFLLVLEVVALPFMEIKCFLTTKDKTYKSILITGGSRGIGAHLALRYAGPGVTIFLIARNEAKLQEAKGQVEAKGATCHIFAADVTDKERMKEVIEKADEMCNLDLVIANAGILQSYPWFEDYERTIAVNVSGAFNTIVPTTACMLKRKSGQICVISSASGTFNGLASLNLYGGTKTLLNYWCHSERAKLAKKNIGLTCICPSYVKTDLMDNSGFKVSNSLTMTVDQCVDEIFYANARNKAIHVFPSYVPFYVAWNNFVIRLSSISF